MHWVYLIAYLFTINLITLFFYWKDKRAAQQEKWRVRERTLHCLGLLGGWPAGWFGQARLRHKSQKLTFQLVFYLTAIINLGLLWAVFRLFCT